MNIFRKILSAKAFLFAKKRLPVLKKNKQKNSGVTLIETIITIVILAFAVSGAIYLMITIVESTAKNKSRITGIYLAQECTELVRNIRDSAWKQNLPWDCAFPDPLQTYRISPNVKNLPPDFANTKTSCQSELGALIENDDGSTDFFQLKKNSGAFSHENIINAKRTPFHRKIKIKKDSNSELTATCEVWWKNKFSKEKIAITETLTNWKKH